MSIWTPQVGQNMVVTLPGEAMRCPVLRLIDRDTVVVEIGQPMAKSHSYMKGDVVAARRTHNSLGELWVVMEERNTLPATLAAATAPEPAPVEKPKAKEKARVRK